ncbi:hypothetical protein BDB00DRAFT_768414 [Zychaea mexicana]|uniref:uncharacterized protein n=1 Tax=Zychaea mexicana TaxID=64656 RepID=UPI0022FF2A3D|nr:uncharacterized protein BDB00DRAFT_768414 [Zychaea mexicana]KAI9490638.1 hypothetical protein BDB00DRAFT_768414 [Zychaea mexicana]
MFSPPSKTLQSSLNTLLDCAQEYLADVCFDYPCGKIWAHRAIILARAPKEFTNKFLSQLLQHADSFEVIVIDEPIVPYSTMQHLLRYWYTAEFVQPSMPPSTDQDAGADTSDDILDQEKRVGTALFRRDTNPVEQLKSDIAAMYESQLGSDVTLKLFTNPKAPATTTTAPVVVPPQQQCAVHRCILAAQSQHFYAMFCKEFREASSSTVYLSGDIFAPTSFNVILRYYYTDKLHIPPGPANDTSPAAVETPHQQSLARKKYSLRLLHDAFRLADYLGDYDTVCAAILHDMAELCNHFKCTCGDCAALLPSMLWFSDKYKSHVPALRLNLITIYSEPVHINSLASLWSAQAFSVLADSKTCDIVTEIVAQITSNIKKQTAIQMVEALHLCLSRIQHRKASSTSTVHQILENLVSHTISIISDNFEFYCVEYPILLSCVDGIAVGSGLSVDFLEFLLTRIMQEGINDRNAGELYQSIVRDLIGRQEMDQDRIVDSVLVDAYQQCVAYLASHWSQVKALGGLKKIEKDIMRRLSEDIEVPYRSLTKSFETDLASLFGFKSRSSNKSKKTETEYGALPPNSLAAAATYPEATGIPSLRELAREGIQNNTGNHHASSRASSSSSLLADALLPMDHTNSSISSTTMSMSASTPVRSTTPSGRPSRLRFELPTMPQRPASTGIHGDGNNVPPNKVVLQPRIKDKKKKNKKNSKIQRSHSPLRARLGWGSSSNSDASDYEDANSGDSLATAVMPVLGAKVELLRRPLPMLGTIKYIGEVHFAKGTYVGVELENRLGSSDGSYNGVRYFHTDQQRGAFCKVS